MNRNRRNYEAFSRRLREEAESDEFFRRLRNPEHPNEIIEHDNFQNRTKKIQEKNRNVRRLNPSGGMHCPECGHDMGLVDEKLLCSNQFCKTRRPKSRYQILQERNEDEM